MPAILRFSAICFCEIFNSFARYNIAMNLPLMNTIRIGENVWEQVPMTDNQAHLLGDECWCVPTVSYGPNLMCHDGFPRPATIIAHNHRENLIAGLSKRLAPPMGGDIIKGSSNKGE